MTALDIANITHNANRTYCLLRGDNSVQAWSDTPDAIRQSVVDGVTKILDGTIHTPEEAHASWWAFKAAGGWLWGPVKDITIKRHPNMKPYWHLPADERLKDAIFFGIVMAFKDAH